MKKLLPSLFLLSMMLSVCVAQSKKDTLKTKNLVKINLSSLALNNYSFQYERKVGKRVSLALGFRYMPESSLPFKSQLLGFLDDDPEMEKHITNFKTGNYAITPELRWYISRKGAPRGFYLAPFARYANYTAKLPFEFDVPNGPTTTYKQSINLSGEVKTITGGLLFGSQWRLSKVMYLDLWLLGLNYGSSNGVIDGKPSKNFTPQEQTELKKELEDLDIPLTDKEITVTANSANVKLSGPWAGVRALGFNLAFRF